MDYKELIEALKSMLPEKVLYGDLIGAEGVYAHSGPLVYEDPEPYFIEQAITAINDLLARVEAAEARAEKAEREKHEAISDLETIMAHGGKLNTCQFCGNAQCYERGGTKPCLPKWRGQKEE